MILDEIYEEKCAVPSDINEHLPTLKDYASKCQTVTEFGVRSIVSTWALIAGRPRQVTSYDLNSPGDKALREVRQIAQYAGVLFVFYQVDVLKTEIASTDLLFIDTYHTYTQLRAELERHAKWVRRWIILHDTETFGEKGEANEENGLNYAIREFVKLNDAWHYRDIFTNNNGLTILQRR